MRLYLFTLFFVSFYFSNLPCGFGQDDRYSEDEIGVANTFIAANGEKLIGNYDKAIELYLQVYKKSRNNAAVCYELARTYHKIGEKEKAVEFSEKSIDLDPDNQWYYIFNAEMLELAAKHKQAADRYKTLVQKDPENKFFYIKWAFNELENGNGLEAIKVFNLLEKKEGITEDVIHRKFNIYVSLNKNSEAIKELVSLSNSEPSNTRYLNNLAGFYMNIGKKKEANKVYKKIIEIDPEDASANIALAGKSASVGKEVSYLKAINPVLSDPQVSLDMKLKELIPFVEKVDRDPSNGITKELLVIAEDLTSIHPNSAKVYSIYGDILFNAGNYKDAEGKYIKTLELNKKVFAVWEQLMYTQSELENFEGLLKSSGYAIDYYPNQAKAYYYNAIANFENDKVDQAKEMLDEAIMMAGKNVPLKVMAYTLYGEIEFKSKSFKASERQAQKAFDIGGKSNPRLLELLGDLSFKNDKVDEAVDFWQKALEAGGTSENLHLKIQQRQIIE